jgi:transposase
MGRKSIFPTNEKIDAVTKCIQGEISIEQMAKSLGIDGASLRQWIRNYETLGIEGLTTTCKNPVYTESFKQQTVLDYLSGNGSQNDICKKYGISSKRSLQEWIIKYNSHEKLKTSGTGGASIMTKGRTTTYDERLEIVQYCIEHVNNYAETAEKYQVSYQQVYTWMKKYETKGINGLVDKRGKRKPENEMSELDKLRAENKLLKAENRRQEMEMAFLKKLDEIERRRF